MKKRLDDFPQNIKKKQVPCKEHRNPDAKRPVQGLMAKSFHPHPNPGGPSKKRQQKKGAFSDPPFPFHGLGFIPSHQQKTKSV